MPDLLPAAPPPTIHQQIASVEREIAMRKRVYPRWIDGGRMTQAKADHEIACMQAVLVTLQHVKQQGQH